MVIGLIICQVLEDEMLHLISKDSDCKRITVIESDPAKDFIQGLCQQTGVRLKVIKDIEEFQSDPEEPMELLVSMLRVGLHMDKELLQEGVVNQAKIMAGKCNVLFLGYGLCGNVLLDIEKKMTDITCPIVMPEHTDGSKVDDCICMVLGGSDKYLDQVYKEAGTWFVTPGWLKHWETLLVKELHCPDIPTVKWIFDRTGYKRCLMVNTGITDYKKFRVASEHFANMFNFYIEEADGTLDLLKECFDRAKKTLRKEAAVET